MKALKCYLLICLMVVCSCSKYLEKKSDSILATIESVTDLQAILGDINRISARKPGVLLQCSDDFFLDESYLGAMEEQAFNQYVWADGNQFKPGGANDWVEVYYTIYSANVVLEESRDLLVKESEKGFLNDVRGQAYFWRGYSLLLASAVWTLAYDSPTAETTLGLPVRKSADFNIPSTRSNLKETYVQILQDLSTAASLLPEQSVHPLRPAKAAAYGALSRTYLYMADFANAERYADSALLIQNSLMDFNSSTYIRPSADLRFKRFNPEVIFDCIGTSTVIPVYGNVDSLLYLMYQENDLRKTLFYRSRPGTPYFTYQGSYAESDGAFFGITVPELLLSRAECRARNGKIEMALDDINRLLRMRFVSGTYVDFTTSDPQIAIQFVLDERRKELACNSLRWMDVKRLNRLGANIELKRILQEVEYKLPPNHPRSAISIPEDVIEISELQQNPR